MRQAPLRRFSGAAGCLRGGTVVRCAAQLPVQREQLLGVSRSPERREDVEYVEGEERTNYPLTLSVDDWGEEFGLTAQVVPQVGAERVCAMMLVTLEQVATALESEPTRPVRAVGGLLPEAEAASSCWCSGMRRRIRTRGIVVSMSYLRSRPPERRMRWRWCTRVRA